jgi:hypothetical protein
MKILKYLILFSILAAPIFAQSQDTICLPSERLGRIADTIAYLRQFERYAIISDSAIVECKSWATALQGQNNNLVIQRDAAVKGGEILAIQLQEQKNVSDKWKQAASDMDIKLQKAKRRGRLFAALFGGAAGGGLLAWLIIGLTK